MIELALQTKRKEDQRGNTPGVSMFEPAPTFGQIIFRPMLVSLSASPWSAQTTGFSHRRDGPTLSERFPRAGATCEW